MLLRGVTEDEILFVLHQYSVTYPAHNGGTSLQAHLPDGSRLVVWLANGFPLIEPLFIKSVVRRHADE